MLKNDLYVLLLLFHYYHCNCFQPPSVESCTGIKFPDLKTTGVSLRSQRMKLPASVGQKKVKAIEQLLGELNLGMSGVYSYECKEVKQISSLLLQEYKPTHYCSLYFQ